MYEQRTSKIVTLLQNRMDERHSALNDKLFVVLFVAFLVATLIEFPFDMGPLTVWIIVVLVILLVISGVLGAASYLNEERSSAECFTWQSRCTVYIAALSVVAGGIVWIELEFLGIFVIPVALSVSVLTFLLVRMFVLNSPGC